MDMVVPETSTVNMKEGEKLGKITGLYPETKGIMKITVLTIIICTLGITTKHR